uniref:OBP3 n=1 Tax=Corythucha ciliata TaxID=369451 RepID=A0A3G2YUX6_CORCT|nr:OBP3 [Corythucha ciliata]
MKTTRATVIVSSLVLLVCAHPPIPEEQKKMIDDCKKETQFTEEMRLTDGLTRDKKCFAACLMKKYGVLHEDGTIDRSKLVENAEKVFPSGIPDKAKSALAECVEIVGHNDDACETAHLLVQCKRDQLAKLNIDPSFAL